jgi:phosphonate transport system permease protein
MTARRMLVAVATLLAIGAWSWISLDMEAARLGEAPEALRQLARDAWPPAAGEDGAFLRIALDGLLDTFQIAFLGTLAGATLSLPLAFLSAHNLVPTAVAVPARLFAAAVRVLPSLLWALLAVLVFGLGPLAGTIAITLYTVGYLAKLQYETLEGIPRDSLDAVRAMGASRFQQAWHVALPEAGNALRSQLFFMFEYNVRASSIVGLVGAGGIGQLLLEQARFAQYDRMFTILLLLFVSVALLDAASVALRRRFIEVGEGRRPRWRDAAADGLTGAGQSNGP